MNILREKQRALGVHRLYCSDSPDMSGVNTAAAANADIARESLAWYKSQYEEQKPMREAASARANAVSDAQLAAMDTQTRLATEADQYNRGTFRPLEQGIVADAQSFDTEAERERLAGLAGADVAQSFGAARSQLTRNLGRAGVNPADGKMLSLEKELAATEALGTGFAKNKARQDAITLSRALKMDAASLGRGLPGQQATATSLALNAGNASTGNAQVPVSLAQSGTSQVGQGFQTSMQANNSAGNLYGQVAQAQGSDDGMWGALGNVAGKAASAFILSDKRQKKGRKHMKGEEAITLARKMPVDEWKYKDDSPAADGGMEHVGPMAQDVHAAGGDKMAPGGKMISLGDLTGMTLAAVQELDKKVTRLEKRRA